MTNREKLFDLKRAAIARRDERQAEIFAAYRAECDADNLAHDRMFDDIRERYRLDMERAKATPKPDHREAAERRDKALAQAERELEEELKEAFLKAETTDN